MAEIESPFAVRLIDDIHSRTSRKVKPMGEYVVKINSSFVNLICYIWRKSSLVDGVCRFVVWIDCPHAMSRMPSGIRHPSASTPPRTTPSIGRGKLDIDSLDITYLCTRCIFSLLILIALFSIRKSLWSWLSSDTQIGSASSSRWLMHFKWDTGQPSLSFTHLNLPLCCKSKQPYSLKCFDLCNGSLSGLFLECNATSRSGSRKSKMSWLDLGSNGIEYK